MGCGLARASVINQGAAGGLGGVAEAHILRRLLAARIGQHEIGMERGIHREGHAADPLPQSGEAAERSKTSIHKAPSASVQPQ